MPRPWIAVVLVASLGCRRNHASDPPAAPAAPAPAITCPAGASVRGDVPPRADRTWCERDDGTMHGPVVAFFDDGRHRLEGGYEAGVKHGTWRTFFADGTRRSEEHYERGVPTGTWATFFADGTPASESVYRDPRTVAFRSFTADGRVQREGILVDGREDGEWKELDASGNLVVVRHGYGLGSTVTPAPVGVAECDEYLVKFSRCITENAPEAARAQMREAMRSSAEAWREIAADPTARAALTEGCRAALDAGRQAATSMGCPW